MQKKYLKWLLLILLFIVVTGIIIIHSLTSGDLKVSLTDLPRLLFGQGEGVEFTIIKSIRLPRIILGLAVGGALSLSGVILQGVYRNPLVEPYTLGISGGASIGVALTIVFGLPQLIGTYMLPLAGFIGALVTLFLVYMLSIRNGKIKIQTMLLVGVMVSFIASSIMMLLLSTTTSENIHSIIFWIMGSLDEPDTKLISLAVIVSLLSLFLSYFFVQPLNALRLGEEKARYLGINTDVSIKILFVITSLLTGVCVSMAGVIGFVGLIIPHLIRLITGSDFRILLISSFIAGGGFLVFCDTLARTIIAPNELPIGVLTGMIGGSIFIIVLNRINKKSLID
ncbi:MAG: iron ABC transporter permease [Bacteroidales bacterium]|nr:MAG: iron ABC transporter permease [Bacteroidales bacterium]